MKIAVNTRFLIKGKLEGIGWFTFEVLKRLVEQHPEDEFIFLFDRPFDKEFIFGKNVKPLVVSPPARHPFLWYLWFECTLPKILKKHKPDVFLSPDNYLSLRTDVKTVMVTHDIAHAHFPNEVPFWARKYYDYFVPRFLNKAGRIVTVSEFTKNDIVGFYNIDSSKIDVSYNGCREEFKPLSIIEKQKVKERYSAGEDYFFYIGAIHPRKNIHRLIAAFDEFKKNTGSSVKLLLGGRFGWQTGVIKTSYEKAEFKEDIVFLGYVDNSELPGLMGAALALTYISLFEGFGVPILEAMHSETPVITSKVSSMPEVAGKAAILIDPDNTTSISEAMENICSNESLPKDLIEKAKAQRAKFSWQRAAEIIYKNLKKAASGSP